jgi:hypothetical protein
MVSSEEIKLKLAAIREGADPEEWVQAALEMQRPLEWIDGSCIIDFDSVPVEDLAITIKTLFEEGGYQLEDGTPVNGIYGRGNDLSHLLIGYLASRYRFKIEIYKEGEITFLKIYKAMTGIMEGIISGWEGLALYNTEFHRIINTIKYLGPNHEGYMVCDKCGGYYKLQPGESPDDFTDKCECGGNLNYIEEADFQEE